MECPAGAPAQKRSSRAFLASALFPAAVLALAGCGRHGRAQAVDPGAWLFDSYQPSAWEQEWRKGEESGERHNLECEFLAKPEDVKRSVQLLRAVRGLVLRGAPVPAGTINLFSRMVYKRCVGPDLKDTGERRVQLIEPLVGILRDPLTICPRPPRVQDEDYMAFDSGEGPVQSKRHLLIGPAAPWSDTPGDPDSWHIGGFTPWMTDPAGRGDCARPQTFLVDMGASLYDEWNGDPASASTSWFVDRFKRQRQAFDWIVAFEVDKHTPEEIYRHVPDDVLPHYIYFNRGVEKSPIGRWNPWRILEGMGVTPRDYVVAKLDIDVPDIEDAIIEQVLDDPKVASVVDEMFFEQHVNVRAMWAGWGQDTTLTMLDSYKLFGALRAKGIRMHSWP